MLKPRGPPVIGRPDAELVVRAAAGDRAAFGEIARRHGAVIRTLLLRMGAQASLADDLAQDAFVIAFQKIGALETPSTVLPWLKQIAARLYIRRWRQDSRLDLMAEPPEPAVHGRIGPADRLDLDEAMKSLTPAQRLCVGLCYGADLTHAEIADALGAPLGTVKSHVKRGLDRLRVRMAGAQTAGSRNHG